MTAPELFTIGFFGVLGLGVFMFFLLGIVETIYGYRARIKDEK